MSFFFSTKRGRDIATNRSTVTASVKNADPTLLNVEFRESYEVTPDWIHSSPTDVSQTIGIGHQEDKKVLPGKRKSNKIINKLLVTNCVHYDELSITLDQTWEKVWPCGHWPQKLSWIAAILWLQHWTFLLYSEYVYFLILCFGAWNRNRPWSLIVSYLGCKFKI